jgi:N-acetyl-anhydromuramyl-L-alanine amidase AmpD
MAEPPSPPYIEAKYKGGYQSSIDRLVIHGTVSETYSGGAKAIAEYFANPSRVSSAHYVVDPDYVYQCVYDHTIAWHDGTNTNSIGIEMCDLVEGPLSRWESIPHQAMLRRTAALVRQLCLAYSIPMRLITPAQIRNGEKGICGHDDMRDAFPGSTSHWDPGKFPWAEFIQLVNGDVSGGGGAAPGQEAEVVTPEDRKAIAADVWTYMIYNHQLKREEWAKTSLGAIQDRVVRQQVQPLRAQVSGLTAAVAALGKDESITLEAVEAIIQDAVKQNLKITGDIEITAKEDVG